MTRLFGLFPAFEVTTGGNNPKSAVKPTVNSSRLLGLLPIYKYKYKLQIEVINMKILPNRVLSYARARERNADNRGFE